MKFGEGEDTAGWSRVVGDVFVLICGVKIVLYVDVG